MSSDRIALPARTFLYTVDQIAHLLQISEDTVRSSFLYYEGRSTGTVPKTQMLARNIAPEGEKPEWRVADRELTKFMRAKGFRYYERGYFK